MQLCVFRNRIHAFKPKLVNSGWWIWNHSTVKNKSFWIHCMTLNTHKLISFPGCFSPILYHSCLNHNWKCITLGTREIAQSKYLSCKYKNQNSIPRTHGWWWVLFKKQNMVAPVCNHRARQSETDPWNKLVSLAGCYTHMHARAHTHVWTHIHWGGVFAHHCQVQRLLQRKKNVSFFKY